MISRPAHRNLKSAAAKALAWYGVSRTRRTAVLRTAFSAVDAGTDLRQYSLVLDVLECLSQRRVDEQRDLAYRMAVLTSPYGAVAPDLIEPSVFSDLCGRLADVVEGRADASPVLHQCEDVFARFPEGEPSGSGFFAFAAVVNVAYAAATFASRSGTGVENCAKRFLDVLDAADDAGADGLCDVGIRWLREPTRELEESLRRAVATHAQQLTAA